MVEKNTRKRKPIAGNAPKKIKATFYLTESLLNAINEDAQQKESNFSSVVETNLNDIYLTNNKTNNHGNS